MVEERIILGEHTYCPVDADEGLLIVCAPTGVYCTVQCGGESCHNPEVEGYYLAVEIETNSSVKFTKALEKFDDCKRGCMSPCLPIGGKPAEMREFDKFGGEDYDWCYKPEEYFDKYGQDIDLFLKENVNVVARERFETKLGSKFYFSFDFDRKYEVAEGWWPVIVQFISEHFPHPVYKRQFKGYLHFGNCD